MRFWLLLLFLTSASLRGQEVSPSPLFATDAPLSLHIRLDLRAFLADRRDSAPYYPAYLHFEQAGQPVQLVARLKAAGHFRRDPDHCDLPPIKLRLRRPDRAGTPFAAHKKLKLVTACQGEAALLREYLVYRTYQCLTPESFQVRLARVTFEDIRGDTLSFTQYAFFLEDDEALAARLGGTCLPKQSGLPPDSLDPQQRLLLHTFQYMIGNTDWDIYLGKNIKLFRLPYRDRPIAVPYDFDWSAAVDAPYTQLGPDFEHRVFRPICMQASAFALVASRFEAAYDDIRRLYRRFPHAPESWTRRSWQYYKAFYRCLRQPDSVAQVFLSACSSG